MSTRFLPVFPYLVVPTLVFLAACGEPSPADTADTDADTDVVDTDDTGGTDTGDTDTSDTDTGGTDTDTGGPDTGGCSVRIASTVPSDGAVDAYYRAPVEFELSDRDPTATVTADFAGTLSTTSSGRTLVYTPDAPLAPNTAYTVTLTWCGGTAELAFTTSALGTPLADVDALAGRVYTLSPDDVRVTAPTGVGPILGTYLSQDVLLRVMSVGDGSITWLGAAVAEAGSRQDMNANTTSFPADASALPYVATAPTDITFEIAGYVVPLQDAVFTGTFAPDGSYVGGVTGAGLLDTRPLVPLLDDEADPGALCDLAASFGATCEACPDDGEPYCLAYAFDQGVARPSTEPVVEVTGGASCATGPVALSLAWLGLGLAAARRRAR